MFSFRFFEKNYFRKFFEMQTFHTFASVKKLFGNVSIFNPTHYLHHTLTAAVQMNRFNSITVHPDIQDGAPVFSGTRVRVETFYDYMRIGVSVNEFLDEFPSITRDQAMEIYNYARGNYAPDQVRALVNGPESYADTSKGRLMATA